LNKVKLNAENISVFTSTDFLKNFFFIINFSSSKKTIAGVQKLISVKILHNVDNILNKN